jgi:diguanylate cyclase (GGDEF)-like protein
MMNFPAQPNAARRSRFGKLSLIQKIGLGYAAMALFTTVALLFSSLSLYRMNLTAREIAGKDLPVINALIKLRSSLQAQQGFAGRYAILKDPAFLELFRQREKESLANLAVLRGAQPTPDMEQLQGMYARFQADAKSVFGGAPGATKKLRSSAGSVLDSLERLYIKRQDALQAVVQQADHQRAEAIRRSVLISCAGFLLAIGVAPFVTYRTFGAIRKLQRATHRIAAGDFDFDPRIEADQELDALAQDFARMAGRLKVLEQLSLDASPLTRLPGNSAIERVLEERLKTGMPFAFCHADLDNFKPYGDHYGYAKGSELLRKTGDLIRETVQQDGDEGFVGHIGGDDFVMLLDVERVAPVCEAVIRNFDAEVLRHYNAEDLEAGGIEGRDRYGVQRFFPVTSITIAVIICGSGQFASAVEIAREAARVKDSAKKVPGSNYLISGSQRELSCSSALTSS